MSHVDYSRGKEESIRFLFKSKSCSHNRRQKRRHKRKNFDRAHCSYQQAFVIDKCKSKSSWLREEDALVCACYASKLIGPCRVYKCDLCGMYHLTTQIEMPA